MAAWIADSGMPLTVVNHPGFNEVVRNLIFAGRQLSDPVDDLLPVGKTFQNSLTCFVFTSNIVGWHMSI